MAAPPPKPSKAPVKGGTQRKTTQVKPSGGQWKSNAWGVFPTQEPGIKQAQRSHSTYTPKKHFPESGAKFRKNELTQQTADYYSEKIKTILNARETALANQPKKGKYEQLAADLKSSDQAKVRSAVIELAKAGPTGWSVYLTTAPQINGPIVSGLHQVFTDALPSTAFFDFAMGVVQNGTGLARSTALQLLLANGFNADLDKQVYALQLRDRLVTLKMIYGDLIQQEVEARKDPLGILDPVNMVQVGTADRPVYIKMEGLPPHQRIKSHLDRAIDYLGKWQDPLTVQNAQPTWEVIHWISEQHAKFAVNLQTVSRVKYHIDSLKPMASEKDSPGLRDTIARMEKSIYQQLTGYFFAIDTVIQTGQPPTITLFPSTTNNALSFEQIETMAAYLRNSIAGAIADDLDVKLGTVEKQLINLLDTPETYGYSHYDNFQELLSIFHGIHSQVPYLRSIARQNPEIFFEILGVMNTQLKELYTEIHAIQTYHQLQSVVGFISEGDLWFGLGKYDDGHWSTLGRYLQELGHLIREDWDPTWVQEHKQPDRIPRIHQDLEEKVKSLMDEERFKASMKWFEEFKTDESTWDSVTGFLGEIMITLASIWVGGALGRLAVSGIRSIATAGNIATTGRLMTTVTGLTSTAVESVGFTATQYALSGNPDWSKFGEDSLKTFLTFGALKTVRKGGTKLGGERAKGFAFESMMVLPEAATLAGIEGAWVNLFGDQKEKDAYSFGSTMLHGAWFIPLIKIGNHATRSLPQSIANKLNKTELAMISAKMQRLTQQMAAYTKANSALQTIAARSKLNKAMENVLGNRIQVIREIQSKGGFKTEVEKAEAKRMIERDQLSIAELTAQRTLDRFQIRGTELPHFKQFEGDPWALSKALGIDPTAPQLGGVLGMKKGPTFEALRSDGQTQVFRFTPANGSPTYFVRSQGSPVKSAPTLIEKGQQFFARQTQAAKGRLTESINEIARGTQSNMTGPIHQLVVLCGLGFGQGIFTFARFLQVHGSKIPAKYNLSKPSGKAEVKSIFEAQKQSFFRDIETGKQSLTPKQQEAIIKGTKNQGKLEMELLEVQTTAPNSGTLKLLVAGKVSLVPFREGTYTEIRLPRDTKRRASDRRRTKQEFKTSQKVRIIQPTGNPRLDFKLLKEGMTMDGGPYFLNVTGFRNPVLGSLTAGVNPNLRVPRKRGDQVVHVTNAEIMRKGGSAVIERSPGVYEWYELHHVGQNPFGWVSKQSRTYHAKEEGLHPETEAGNIHHSWRGELVFHNGKIRPMGEVWDQIRSSLWKSAATSF